MFFKIIGSSAIFFLILETDQIALLIWITNIPFLTIFQRKTSTTIPWLKNWKNIIYSSYQTASEFFRYSFRATLFSPLMNACDFVFQKYEKFLSILLGHFIKHKPLISEEWETIFMSITIIFSPQTTDINIILSYLTSKFELCVFWLSIALYFFFWTVLFCILKKASTYTV